MEIPQAHQGPNKARGYSWESAAFHEWVMSPIYTFGAYNISPTCLTYGNPMKRVINPSLFSYSFLLFWDYLVDLRIGVSAIGILSESPVFTITYLSRSVFLTDRMRLTVSTTREPTKMTQKTCKKYCSHSKVDTQTHERERTK
jgi:hypothetical protein